MSSWPCCRLCLDEKYLNPIFLDGEQKDKYSAVIFNATGVKIQMNDSLPQKLCSNCVNFINSCSKFRKKCEMTQKILIEKYSIYNATVEQQNSVKEENELYLELNISDDYEHSYQNDCIDSKNNLNCDKIENTYSDSSLDDKPLEVYQRQKLKKKKKQECSKKSKKTDGGIAAKKKRKLRKNKNYSTEENCVDETNKERKSERVKEQIECEYCHKILTSRLSLRNHYKIHTGFDIVCEHCGKKFITKRLLLMHCRAKHGYEKIDKCSYCDYRGSNAEQVKIHERLHTGERPYVCCECGAGFHRNSSYLQHVAIHAAEKTVQCDQCPALFKSVTLMRIHKNRHKQPTYSFKCHMCGGSFARRRNVARHLQRIHAVCDTDSRLIERIKIA